MLQDEDKFIQVAIELLAFWVVCSLKHGECVSLHTLHYILRQSHTLGEEATHVQPCDSDTARHLQYFS